MAAKFTPSCQSPSLVAPSPNQQATTTSSPRYFEPRRPCRRHGGSAWRCRDEWLTMLELPRSPVIRHLAAARRGVVRLGEQTPGRSRTGSCPPAARHRGRGSRGPRHRCRGASPTPCRSGSPRVHSREPRTVRDPCGSVGAQPRRSTERSAWSGTSEQIVAREPQRLRGGLGHLCGHPELPCTVRRVYSAQPLPAGRHAGRSGRSRVYPGGV